MNKHKLNSLKNTDVPNCETHIINLDNVRSSKLQILPTTEAQQIAEVLSLLADTNRLRLISALASQELCVCDLAALTAMSESAVCHQLRLLKVMHLVSYRREGRKVYYSLVDSRITDLYKFLVEHLSESNTKTKPYLT